MTESDRMAYNGKNLATKTYNEPNKLIQIPTLTKLPNNYKW